MKNIILILCTLSVFGCNSDKELKTVDQLNIDKYLGTWYEIARLPNSFEKGLKCTTATYSLKENGKIKVLNAGFNTEKNKSKSAEGTAWVPNEEFPAQLKVSFFWPFGGDYYIIELDKEYQYALVGSPSRDYLWILARDKSISEELYSKLTQKASAEGFDVAKLIKVEQDC